MTEQEKLLQRREVLYRQIDVMTLFEEDFLEEMSKRELDYHIDKILDEIILIRKLLKEIGYDH